MRPKNLAKVAAATIVSTVLLPALPHRVELNAETVGRPREKESSFLRLRRDEGGQPQALETAITTYVPTDGSRSGLVVELVSAVHVGDASYYQQLNHLFRSYDVLLYELVAPQEATATKRVRGGGNHPVSALQRGMKRMLELEFQLEAIDYTKDNLVHADMSPAEFAQSMKDRGETFLEIFFRAFGQAMAVQSRDPSRSSDVEMLVALFAPDRARRLKRAMAEQFESMGGLTLGLDGPQGSTIITERNKRALSVLSRQIDQGHRRIGIFFGAAHMPDMERRLTEKYGFKRTGERWIPAWDLTRQSTKR